MGPTPRRSAILAVTALSIISTISAPAPTVAGAAGARPIPPGNLTPGVPTSHRTVGGTCVVNGGTQGFAFENAALAVRSHPTRVAAVWLPGLNTTSCKVALTHGGATVARRLAADIAGAVYVRPGSFSCPMTDGTSVRLSFLFRTGPYQTVHVALDGCAWVTSRGTKARAVTAALRRDLLTITPAAWRTHVTTTPN
jgi:hypothetical protein